MAHIVTEVYEKICDGDHVTDAELRVAFTHFAQLELLAHQAGPVFRLAASEARRVRDRLASYAESRKLSI